VLLDEEGKEDVDARDRIMPSRSAVSDAFDFTYGNKAEYLPILYPAVSWLPPLL
jgi:hypothetical protein